MAISFIVPSKAGRGQRDIKFRFAFPFMTVVRYWLTLGSRSSIQEWQVTSPFSPPRRRGCLIINELSDTCTSPSRCPSLLHIQSACWHGCTPHVICHAYVTGETASPWETSYSRLFVYVDRWAEVAMPWWKSEEDQVEESCHRDVWRWQAGISYRQRMRNEGVGRQAGCHATLDG